MRSPSDPVEAANVRSMLSSTSVQLLVEQPGDEVEQAGPAVSAQPLGGHDRPDLGEGVLAGWRKLARVTETAFGQRRKMLRQSLKGIGGERLFEAAGIDGTRRAETLSVEEFVALANAL